MLCSR